MNTGIRVLALRAPVSLVSDGSRLRLHIGGVFSHRVIRVDSDLRITVRRAGGHPGTLVPLQSFVWTWLAGLQVRGTDGRTEWLLSWQPGRSDQALRRTLACLPTFTDARRVETPA